MPVLVVQVKPLSLIHLASCYARKNTRGPDLHVHSEGGRLNLLLRVHCNGGGLRGDAHILEGPLLKLQHNTSLRALEDRHCVAVEDANH